MLTPALREPAWPASAHPRRAPVPPGARFALSASAAVRSRFNPPRLAVRPSVTAPATPLVSFVIPVRNDAQRLSRCLKSIKASRYPAHRIEIIVVDNGSRDGSDAVARNLGARVISLPGLRVSELRNKGAQVASGAIIAFVDADHEINQAWVRSAVDTFALERVGASGAQYVVPQDVTWVQRMYDGFRDRVPGRRPVEWLASGNLAVSREAFTRAHGFDTSLETCEDVDLCQRLRRIGYRVMSDSRLKSVHFGDPATLWALFCGELWRGRDNFRASLRGPITVRGLPSVVIPAIDLTMLLLGLIALIAAPTAGLLVAAVAVAVIGGFAALRAGRLAMHLKTRSLGELAQAFAVASVYDLARALAPVSRAGYAVRRPSARG
jgi:GT2 family glycosyltransferase